MADLHTRELERKVAHYEAIMRKCPQCKEKVTTPESEAVTVSSLQSRSTRSAQQLTAITNPPNLAGPSKRLVPPQPSSSSARSAKQHPPTSRTELPARGVQQDNTSSVPLAARSSRSHQSTEARVPTLQHPPKISSNNLSTRSAASSRVEPSGHLPTSTQDPHLHPSFPDLGTSEGRQLFAGAVVALDLQLYKRTRSQVQGGRPSGESPRHGQWVRSAELMIEEVPSGRSWRQKLSSMDSSIIAAVTMDNAPVPEGDASPIEDAERIELLRIVRRFAQRHSAGRIDFQHLILACLCKVLSFQGIPKGKIVETLQICISDTKKETIDRYLKGVTWVNRIINDLFLTNWGYRAVDLVVIWNRHVSTYGRLASTPDSHQYFITELTQRKYFEGYREVPGRRHDTIPWILKRELGAEVSYVLDCGSEIHTYRGRYESICKALCYNDDFFKKTRHLHSNNPASPDVNTADSADNAGITSQSPSFRNARESTVSASSSGQSTSGDKAPTGTSFSLTHSREASLLNRQFLQDDSSDDETESDSPAAQCSAFQRTYRVIPDRSARPLEDPDTMRRRTPPNTNATPPDLPVPTSPGVSAQGTQSTKRPLPDSPTSALQSDGTTRRRKDHKKKPSRKDTGSPSHSGNKDLRRT